RVPELNGEGLRIGARIGDGGHDLELAELGARIPLDGLELLRVRMADEVEPEEIVEPDRLDDERVALPVTDRVAVPRGLLVVGMLAAIHEDLPEAMDVALEQEE